MNRKFVRKTWIVFIGLLLLLGIWAGKGAVKYYIFGGHDVDANFMRVVTGADALKEGQLPLRWSGTLNQDCGIPVFNFFYPGTFYVTGLLVNVFQQDAARALVWVFASSFFVGAFFMYLWLKEETKDELASFTGSCLYLLAPYRFLLVYVRGSTEAVAYALLPVVLWLVAKTFQRKEKNYWWFVTAAIAGGVFMISHNLVVLMIFPLAAGYTLWKFKVNGKLKMGILLICCCVLLASFFWGPALLEMKYLRMARYPAVENFREHFPLLKQLIYSPWGYFYTPGHRGQEYPTGINFSLGVAQWLTLALGILLVIKTKFKNYLVLGLVCSICFCLFLNLRMSEFLWEAIKPMQTLQFPWRWLGVSVLLVAVLGSLIVKEVKIKWLKICIVCLLIGSGVYANRNHLMPLPVMDESIYKNPEKHHLRKSTTTISDEILNIESMEACDPAVQSVMSEGNIKFDDIKTFVMESSGKITFISQTSQGENLILRLEYYPEMYEFAVNNLESIYENHQGKVALKNVLLKQGVNVVDWKIRQTAIQKIFNVLSLMTFLILVTYPFWRSLRLRK